MRKVKYAVGVSLDGYIAGLDGSVEWLERATRKAKGEDFGMGAFFKSIDTVLMGRKTYEIALKLGMGKSGYPEMKNYVFSRTLPPGERDGVEFVADDPAKMITRLKKQPGKDIWLCGGGELARAMLRGNAVDEIILGIVPLLVGAGRPTFPPEFPETVLELLECKQYKGSVIGLTYKVLPAATERGTPRAKAKKRANPRTSSRREAR